MKALREGLVLEGMFNNMFQLEQVKQLPEVMNYLPDLKAGKYPEKEFFNMVSCNDN